MVQDPFSVSLFPLFSPDFLMTTMAEQPTSTLGGKVSMSITSPAHKTTLAYGSAPAPAPAPVPAPAPAPAPASPLSPTFIAPATIPLHLKKRP